MTVDVMANNVIREITPLKSVDCFVIFSTSKLKFDFPLHYHDEYELKLIIDAEGAKRVIGGHVEVINNLELVLIGPNVCHTWLAHRCKSNSVTAITIQFQKDLFDDKLLLRNQLTFVKNMLERSKSGVIFSQDTIASIKDSVIGIVQKSGFDSFLELLSILHDLSLSRNTITLPDVYFANNLTPYNSPLIEKIHKYINQRFHQQVTLTEVSKIANMSESSFCRFIKQQTGNTFIDVLNEIRVCHASRMLVDTTKTVAEIAIKCGFINISNFNRVFKHKKFCNPKDFRKTYVDYKVLI
jgi:AraC-like DNA-binding protein